jgi:hypothetical protein
MQSPRPAETIIHIYRRIHLLGRSSSRAADATAAFLGCSERAGALAVVQVPDFGHILDGD